VKGHVKLFSSIQGREVVGHGLKRNTVEPRVAALHIGLQYWPLLIGRKHLEVCATQN